MKKLVLILIGVLISTTVFAGINQVASENKMYNLLKSSKNKCENIISNLTSFRQSIEDILLDEADNLDATDKTKMGALPTEIQDIIDAANDLKTKIETHYPEVK